MKIPKKLGKYEIKTKIGRGNMGIVYRGYDPFANRDVAIKIAVHSILQNKKKEDQELFFNEAHLAGTLQHPNIINILDAGVEDDICYIIMELVENAKTLRSHCKVSMLLPIKEAVSIIFKCAVALDYAHRNGVIHRDIKPTNILLTPSGDVKIADFGIAKTNVEDTGSNVSEGFAGSPRYMSPEQMKGNINNQTDLFSLGIILYELLVGKHPFYADNLNGLMHNICNEKPQPIKQYREDLPNVLEKIIRRVLHKNTGKRYKKGTDLAGDLSLVFDQIKDVQDDTILQERFHAMKQLAFFYGFADSEILEIIHACIWQEHEADIKVITEGDVDDSFYVIISGEVSIWKENTCIGNLKMGDCFGEMNYLSKDKRTASIITHSKTALIKINAISIEQASVNCQLRFNRQFIRTLIHRLSVTTSKYISEKKQLSNVNG